MAAGRGLGVRILAEMPAGTMLNRNVMPGKPTSEATCMSIGMLTSAAAGVPTDPPELLKDARKSNAVRSVAKANIAATGPSAYFTGRAPLTAPANARQGAPMER